MTCSFIPYASEASTMEALAMKHGLSFAFLWVSTKSLRNLILLRLLMLAQTLHGGMKVLQSLLIAWT